MVDINVEIFLRLFIATLLGGFIGINRELMHQPAGLRTHAIVGLGAAIAVSLFIQHSDAMSRVIQGIITGIGFLGAGVILRTENGQSVHGLTTAATIWLSACLGCACGAGAWSVAGSAFVLVMLILLVGGPLERWIQRRFGHGFDDGRSN